MPATPSVMPNTTDFQSAVSPISNISNRQIVRRFLCPVVLCFALHVGNVWKRAIQQLCNHSALSSELKHQGEPNQQQKAKRQEETGTGRLPRRPKVAKGQDRSADGCGESSKKGDIRSTKGGTRAAQVERQDRPNVQVGK